jgi:hypothetical protein
MDYGLVWQPAYGSLFEKGTQIIGLSILVVIFVLSVAKKLYWNIFTVL